MKIQSHIAAGAGAALLVAAQMAQAMPSLNANWYTLATGHSDTNVSIPGLTTGLVESTLGPNGLPVRTAFSASQPATSSNNIKDVDGGTNEILWWSPGSRSTGTVAVDAFYPATVSVPYVQLTNLFPGGSGSNGGSNGFLSAHLFGLFDAPAGGTVTFTLGADDDAWIFINNQLVVDLGGVKPLTAAPITVAGLSPGTNRFDLFFADRNVVQSGLRFEADVVLRPVPVPEPTSLALVAVGLIALSISLRRAKAQAGER
jgi:fibro-slime domain-containing protein